MSRVGYVLKVYPRFSETFVVTEILAREAAGEDLAIFALRPTTDSRFHPEIARVKAPVRWIPRNLKGQEQWLQLTSGLHSDEARRRFAQLLPVLATLPGDEVAQGVGLAKAVEEEGITHLHAHFASLAGRIAWIASRLSGVPFTVTTHAKDIFHESVDREWLRRICSDADRVIAISLFNEDYLAEVLAGTGARVSLLRNGLELSRFPYRGCEGGRRRAEPLRILAVGRLVPKKGFDDLLDALHLLKTKGREVHLDLAGEGELAAHLAGRVAQLGLARQVNLLGPRTQSEVRDLLSQADLFAAPCRIADDGNMDGLPTVVLEAMATGTPVVATAVTGLPEAIHDGDTGILLTPGDVTGLAEAIEDVDEGRVNGPALARAARTLIEEEFDAARQALRLGEWESRRKENN